MNSTDPTPTPNLPSHPTNTSLATMQTAIPVIGADGCCCSGPACWWRWACLGWLFSGAATRQRMPIGDLPWVDGTLTIVEPTHLQMATFEPLDGKTIVDFTILPRDQGGFDLAHIRTHSSLPIPTRIFYERDGDTYLAVLKSDAPLNVARR